MLCSINFFLENHAFYEINYKIMVKPVWPQMKIWHMRLAILITKVRNIHTEYVIFVGFFM